MADGIPVRIISDMRVTIPKEYREHYDLEENDRVWVKVEPIEEGENVPWVVNG